MVGMRTARAIAVTVTLAAATHLIQAQQEPPPQFRAEINYVEVDARVLDASGRPLHGLTQQDFAVFEDGVRQTLTNFSVVDIPITTATGETAPSAAVKPDVAENTQGGEKRRSYLIVLDDASISSRLTNPVRTFLQRFIERSIGPDDLVGVTTTGRDNAYENFTSNKPRLIAAVNRMVGEGGSPAITALTDIGTRASLVAGGRNSSDTPVASATTADPRSTQRQLVQMIHAMSSTGSGSKAIIFVSQGIPFQMVTRTEGLTLIGDVERVSIQARRSNVPIYTVDPRGLASGSENTIDVAIVSQNDHPEQALLNETRLGQDHLRALADDSGGLPVVGVNDIGGGLDRIVTMTSFYYVLGYYSTNNRRDGKYRKIDVRVDRPGAHVLNRRGYTAAMTGGPKGPALAGPPKSSTELREALNAVLPTAGLPLAMTAAAFRQMNNNHVSVAVVLETLGSELTWKDDVLAAPVEMTAVAMEKRGVIKAGEVNRLQLSTHTDTADRVRQFGFRWLARLDDLTPGHYQVRAAVANGPAKQGSVWYDIDIPDFSKSPLAMSDVVLASQVAMLRPTLRPDRLLAEEMPGPPTTLREFPEGGSLAVYAEVYDNQLDRPHDLEATVVVANDHGEIAYRTVETRTSRQLSDSHGVVRVKVGIPLVNIRPGNYTLTVDARQTVNRAISAGRAVPFKVVRPAGR
jgi:VWFA-related protein